MTSEFDFLTQKDHNNDLYAGFLDETATGPLFAGSAFDKSETTPPPLTGQIFDDLESPLSALSTTSSSASSAFSLNPADLDLVDLHGASAPSNSTSMFTYSHPFKHQLSSYDDVADIDPRTIDFADPFATVASSSIPIPMGLADTSRQSASTTSAAGIVSPSMTRRSPVLKSQAGDISSLYSDIEPYLTIAGGAGAGHSGSELDSLSPVLAPQTPQLAPPISLHSTSLPALSSSISLSAISPSTPARSRSGSDFNSASASSRHNHSTVHAINGKRISDSRLSLAQLAVVLGLGKDVKETSKREKEVLSILRNDLGFPLGEKTWIRDTPVKERDRLLDELVVCTEMRYHYGYSREILSVVVRRASYYLMQGRLRRERRLSRKQNSERRRRLSSTTSPSPDL